MWSVSLSFPCPRFLAKLSTITWSSRTKFYDLPFFFFLLFFLFLCQVWIPFMLSGGHETLHWASWKLHLRMGLNPVHVKWSTWNSTLTQRGIASLNRFESRLQQFQFQDLNVLFYMGKVFTRRHFFLFFCYVSLIVCFLFEVLSYNLVSLHSMWKDIILVTGWHYKIHEP